MIVLLIIQQQLNKFPQRFQGQNDKKKINEEMKTLRKLIENLRKL